MKTPEMKLDPRGGTTSEENKRLDDEIKGDLERLREEAPERYIVKNPWTGQLMNILQFEGFIAEGLNKQYQPAVHEAAITDQHGSADVSLSIAFNGGLNPDALNESYWKEMPYPD